jgi:hypothetical protein
MTDKEHYIKAAEHFVRSSKEHHALRDTLRKIRQMHKAEMDDEGAMDLFDSAIDSCDALGNNDAAHAEHYIECAKSAPDGDGEPAAKAAGLSNSRMGIAPDRVSGIAPEAPNVRAIPRAGAPEMRERSDVPLEFEKLVAIEGD